MLRRAAAGSALLALACVVAVVLTSADVGFEALLAQAKLPSREPAAVDPGHTEQLHWGHKWLKSHHYNHPHYWGGAGCEHDFRDLCNENYYHHNVHPFLLHHKWLDGSERLEQAHKFDEEEETAFQEATKELHNKVLVEREDWNAEMKELHEEKQDKYKAYFLRLEAEKNQTSEILSQWKEKRDAEVAKIDADYLQNIGNVTTGRDQYKSWYDEALALDEERQAKFKTMIADMKAAGASDKDVKTATLAFKRQESLFQGKLKAVSSTFDEDHERKELLQMKAKQELAKFKALRKKEHSRQAEAEHKYEAEQAKERAEAQKTADDIMHERQEVASVQKQAHSYADDLQKVGSAEDKRQDSFEARIRLAKRKEQQHAAEMQKKAAAEVAADQAVHAGENPGEKKTVSAKHTKMEPEKQEEPEKDLAKAPLKKKQAAKVVFEKKQATAAREKKEVTAAAKDTVAATRQAAFLKALSQQADAEFQSMPQSV